MKLKTLSFGTFIFTVILIVIYVIINIYSDFFDYRGAGFSGDIESSKRLGVFSHEYVVEPETLKIDSTFTLRFGETWSETAWSKGNYFKPVKEPSREERKGYKIYIQIIGFVDFALPFYDKYSVHTIDNDSTSHGFGLKFVGNQNIFLFELFRKLDNNEMTIYIKEKETDSTKGDLRKIFFTIRKK